MAYRNPLWSPEYTGRKPAFNDMGALRLNLDNKLNQGLVAKWLFNERAPGCRELISGAIDTATCGWGVSSKYGPGLYNPSNASTGLSVTSAAVKSNIGRLKTVGTLTARVCLQIDVNNAEGQIIWIYNSFADGYCRFSQNYSTIYATVGDNSQAITLSLSGSVGLWDLVLVKVGKTASLYVNGALADSDSNASMNGFWGADPENVYLYAINGQADRIHLGGFELWNRALPEAEISELYYHDCGTPANPRFIVEPRRTWFVPSGAASGPANLKTVHGLAKANVKTIHGLAIGSVKSLQGLT